MFSFHNCVSTILAALVFVVVILSDHGLGRSVYSKPICKSCSGVKCGLNVPQNCQFGEHLDRCNRTICSKGPGERCGERLNVLGICGEGLWCSSRDNRCHGCYIPTMDCYQED